MNKSFFLLLPFLYCFLPLVTNAQETAKSFEEGAITYHAAFKSLSAATPQIIEGTFTFTLKGKTSKRELVLNNGYRDVTIANMNDNSLYTLETMGDKKYAIQHNMAERAIKLKRFEGFAVKDDAEQKNINGYTGQKARIIYLDGTTSDMYYAKVWNMAGGVNNIFDRLPTANYIPLDFTMVDEEKNLSIHFTLEKIEAKPVESGYLRIPTDYKIITYADYKQLTK